MVSWYFEVNHLLLRVIAVKFVFMYGGSPESDSVFSRMMVVVYPFQVDVVIRPDDLRIDTFRSSG